MPSFIEELAVKDYMKVALVLKSMQLLSIRDYEEISMPVSHKYKQASHKQTFLIYKRTSTLAHAMYKMIEADPSSAYKIRNVLTNEGDMHDLVVGWEERGKCLINCNN